VLAGDARHATEAVIVDPAREQPVGAVMGVGRLDALDARLAVGGNTAKSQESRAIAADTDKSPPPLPSGPLKP
jgi:hypothetical protein